MTAAAMPATDTQTTRVAIGQATITTPPVSADEETIQAVIHDALTCMADAPGVAGRLRMARILTGAQTPADHDALIRMPLHATHGSVDVTQADCVRILDALLTAGLCAQTPGIRPVLVLTRAGYSALNMFDEIRETRAAPVE